MKFWYLTVATSLLSTLLLHGTRALAQVPAPQAAPLVGCLSGYPDQTFQGDRPMTRNEFAAGMDTCLRQVDQSIRVNQAELAPRAEFERLIQRQRELNNQVRELSDRIDTLSNESPLRN